MFSHIDLKGLASSTQFGYAAGVPFFKDKKKIAFKPGLNILVGPNGSGKSTVLRMLAESTCSFQGGVSAITEHAISQGVDMMAGLRLNGGAGKHKDKLGLKVHHDGQPVVFSDPRQAVGLDSGAFDDDFFEQGLAEVTAGRRQSHGQLALSRTSMALSVLEDKKRFPGILQAGTPDAPYYTNSSQLPVGFTDDAFEALRRQEPLQSRYTGGTVLHLYMGERISSAEACKKLVRRSLENFRLPYITVTPTFSICPKHGYIAGEHEFCPICDAEKLAARRAAAE